MFYLTLGQTVKVVQQVMRKLDVAGLDDLV